jgi:hypothetical protein
MEDQGDMMEISFEAPIQDIANPLPHVAPNPVRGPQILRDPVAEKKRRLNIQGDQRIIRDINEITVDVKLDDSIQALVDCRFLAPREYVDTVRLSKELRTVTAVCNRLLMELEQPGAVLTRHQKIALKVARQRLMELLYRPNTFIDDPHTFTERWVDKTIRLDIYIFHAILLCSEFSGREPAFQQRLLQFQPKSPDFASLMKQKLFWPGLLDRPFMTLTAQELIVSVNYLESRWNYIDYVKDDLRMLLDLYLARVASMAVVFQEIQVFGSLTKYRTIVGVKAKISTQFLEDFCWSLMKMYKKLTFCEIMMQYNTPIPFEITNEDADELEKKMTATALQMKNTALQAKYFTAYMNGFLRPSEALRYRRDHPGLEMSGSMIIEKMRGSAAKNVLMEKLSGAPWEITRDKQLHPYELDLMYLMMLDTRVNNSSNKLNWMSVMLYFNVHLLDMPNPIGALTAGKDFPMLVQAFNGTGVFYQGKYYDHNGAAKAFLHWLCIMLLPPFKGKWTKHNFGGLHVLLPEAVKARAGLQFMNG